MPPKVAKRVDARFLSDHKLRKVIFRNGSPRESAWTELVRRHESRVSRAVAVTLVRLGIRPHTCDVEDLVEATWLRVTGNNHRVLRAWNPGKGESLGAFFAQVGIWETRTSRRLWTRRKEVKLDEAELRRIADRPDGRLGPDEVAQLKEAEVKVRAWEANLGLWDRRVWEMRKEGAGSRLIGLFLGRDHKTVCCILKRIQQGLCQILIDSES